MESKLAQLRPTERFSQRVDNYSKYRPSYPIAIIDFLEEAIGLQPAWAIADIGSGTGIFSTVLLQQGYTVTGVEPNQAMREEAEKHLDRYTKFTSINGKAEATTLPDHSIQLITVAQAFHWMDPVLTKQEFNRILEPGGHMVLLWNIRLTHTRFLEAFEAIKIQFGTDYKATRMVNEQEVAAFFAPLAVTQKSFYHSQVLDYEGLKGQLLSTSYMPLEGERYNQMILALEELFDQHHENGFVKIEFETKVYLNK
ncbi:type 11 methyltransferase [Russula earlei]|uniref:Type 11 methyltransferase n=1 Tax=Russula earlei TaxID=71964 RepID=A0ACC0TXC4_9AGAM|nr:type 11 methyltransferase [Russula earlei]